MPTFERIQHPDKTPLNRAFACRFVTPSEQTWNLVTRAIGLDIPYIICVNAAVTSLTSIPYAYDHDRDRDILVTSCLTDSALRQY